MANITDLPEEVLGMIACYLSSLDIKHLLSTSRDLHRPLLKLELFGEIDWRFDGFEGFLRRPTDSMTVANGHALAIVLSKNIPLAGMIRRLTFHYDHCKRCPQTRSSQQSRRPCRHLSVNTMTSLTSVREMTIVKYARFLSDDFALPPNLEILRLGRPAWKGVIDWNPQLQVSKLVPVLMHPKLRTLLISAGFIRAGKDATKIPEGVVFNIKSLQLRTTTIDPATLVDILEHIAALTSFAFTRSQHSLPNTRLSSALVKVEDLKLALQTIQTSVEAVEITYADRHRWSGEIDTIDFSAFSKLRSLRIDPSLVLGRSMCPFQFASSATFNPNYSPPSALVSRLPESLEVLQLAVDLEQTARVNDYREDMLQALLTERASLPSLRRIVIYEFRGTQSNVQSCGCFDNTGPYTCPMRSRRGRDAGLINVVQQKNFLKFKDEFQKVGVVLEYVGVSDSEPHEISVALRDPRVVKIIR